MTKKAGRKDTMGKHNEARSNDTHQKTRSGKKFRTAPARRSNG